MRCAHLDLELEISLFLAEGEDISGAQLLPDAGRQQVIVHPGLPRCHRIVVAIMLGEDGMIVNDLHIDQEIQNFGDTPFLSQKTSATDQSTMQWQWRASAAANTPQVHDVALTYTKQTHSMRAEAR